MTAATMSKYSSRACFMLRRLIFSLATLEILLHFSLEQLLLDLWPNDDKIFIIPAISKHSADTTSPGVLNIHVVPHTHDDVGWRKTVDQYFYGWNNSIDTRGAVSEIITTSIEALIQNPARTFVYVEQKFFSLWWMNQSDAMRDSVRYLVANQQLEFLNGGWCMHDEASTHYMGMMDQTSLGHAFLFNELGVTPTIGWQLDPFGHSSTQASLLSYRAGLDAIYFGRIDYQDLKIRKKIRQCEGLWNASANDDATIFWGLTGSYSGNYGPPGGFCFDQLCGKRRTPLLGLSETRLVARMKEFLQAIALQANQTQGQHVMLTWGTDFTYQDAATNYANLDVLISSVMNFQRWNRLNVSQLLPGYDRVNIFYSTPGYYTRMKYTESKGRKQHKGNTVLRSRNISWQIKGDDFFPYSNCPHCFWTGYFASRVSFKRFERVASGFLMAARQIQALYANPAALQGSNPLYELEDALGVAQHHDGISGTAKQHVADDYSFRLQKGLDIAAQYVAEQLSRTVVNGELNMTLHYCPRLNETVCNVTYDATARGSETDLYAVVYNPLSREQSTLVRFPVASDGSFEVQRVKSSDGDIYRRQVATTRQGMGGSFVLMFDSGPLPPLGAVVFRITLAEETVALNETELPDISNELDAGELVEFSNGPLTVTFEKCTGAIASISSKDVTINLTQTWGYYTSYDIELDGKKEPKQNSGAYIFRPQFSEQELIEVPLKCGAARFLNTSVGLEVHSGHTQPWIQVVTRLPKNRPYIEVEYTIGPVPIEDGRGKEIVTRWSTPIESHGLFYTDSNAREFLKRKRNARPTWELETFQPIAGNYYPINAAIALEDANASLAVVVDRSLGGASLHDGACEIMVHRRILADDGRGVDEPLNETVGGMTAYPPYGLAERLGDGVVVKGVLRIIVGSGNSGSSMARSLMDEAFAQPIVFFGETPASSSVDFLAAPLPRLAQALPPNIMLLTLIHQPWKEEGKRKFLLRLGHQYSLGEHQTLSKPVQINLSTLFDGFQFVSATEKTLGGIEDWERWMQRRLDWNRKSVSSYQIRDPSDPTFTMSPMEVRTFEIVVESKPF